LNVEFLNFVKKNEKKYNGQLMRHNFIHLNQCSWRAFFILLEWKMLPFLMHSLIHSKEMHIHIHHAHAHAQEQQQKVEQTIPVAEKELGISVLVMCILLERIGNGKNGIISEKYVQCFYRFRDYVCHPILQEEPITKNRIMQDLVSSIIARHLVHILKDEMQWNSEMRLCEETLSAYAHSDYSSNLSPPFPVLSAIKLGSKLLHNLIGENENHRHLHHQFSETIFPIALRLLSRPSSFFSRSYSKGSRQQTVIRVEGNQQQQKQEEMDIFSIHKSIVGSLLPKCLRFDALTREVHPTSKDKERSVFIKRLEVNSSR